MKNLLKNNVRSWKNNKISIVGLSFLTFFGLGSYCILSNTIANIGNQYSAIAKKGALHDITVSELYNLGNARYQTNTGGIKLVRNSTSETFSGVESFWSKQDKVETTKLFTGNYGDLPPSPTQEETYYIPVPEQKLIEKTEGKSFVRKYHVTLDKDLSTNLFAKFADNSQYKDYESLSLKSFDIVITETYVESSAADKLNTILEKHKGQSITTWPEEDYKTVASNNVFKKDFKDFTAAVNSQTNKISSYVTSENTPMMNEMSNKYSKEIDFRTEKSINVTVASEFYKVVESNPNDKVNKIVLFNDINGRTGGELPHENDFAPYNGKIEFYNLKDGKIIAPGTPMMSAEESGQVVFYIPKNLSELMNCKIYSPDEVKNWPGNTQFAYSQLMQIRFKSIKSGKLAAAIVDSFGPLCEKLAAVKKTTTEYYDSFVSGEIHDAYVEYYNDWYLGCAEMITISQDGSTAITWTVGPTPQTCKVSNWTSKFVVVNPQYLKANNKSTLDPNVINNFEPYAKWYKATFGTNPSVGQIDHKAVVKWFNTLTYDQFNFWVQPASTLEKMEYTIEATGETVIFNKSEGKWWKGVDKDKNMIGLSGFNLIIWGCGLTPDYVYPVVDITRPTPNHKTEAIVFANTSAWKSVKHGYAAARVESFIVARFKGYASKAHMQSVINQLNAYSDELCKEKIMNLPKGTKVAFFADDTNNIFNSSAIRVSCIPSLLKTITIVTAILSSFILILCAIICFIIIKRFVEANRVNIGIMRANGFSKRKIAFSLLPFSILPSIIGGVLAYFIGFLLQMPALMLFKDFWTLPTSLVGFSFLSFFGCIFVPFILFSVISIIATMVVLRTKAVELMKSGSEFKANGFSRLVKKPFRKFGIMTRFRVSLAFNSIARLLMLGIVSTLTMSTLVFAMTSYNRLSNSQKINKSQFDYQYSIDLTTPTSSGGPYSTIAVDGSNGIGQTNVNDYWYNTSWDLSDSEGEGKWQETKNYSSHLTRPYASNFISSLEGLLSLGAYKYRDTLSKCGTLMLPNMADSTGQNWDLMYLQNKVCSRILLDYNIGIGSMSSNPWEIALSLMPVNSRNLAEEAFNKIVQKAGEQVAKATAKFNYYFQAYGDRDHAAAYAGRWFYLNKDDETDNSNQFAQFFTRKNDPQTGLFVYSLNADFSNVGYLFMVFKQPYLKLLSTIYSDPEVYNLDYSILYGAVEVKQNVAKPDEKYTYVNATIDSLSTKPRVSIPKNTEIKIEGITYPSSFIKLTDKSGKSLNNEIRQILPNGNIPVVVNAFAAHKYRFNIGSTITVSATNTVDRYERKMHPEKYKNEKDKFYQKTLQVVGISQGTNGDAFYIDQAYANGMVGLPDGISWNKTHKYLMYTEDISTNWGYGADALPKVVDLASTYNAVTQQRKSIVYSFDETGKAVKQTEIPAINETIPVGFNGIYTSDKEGKPLTQILSLYSPTGLWPGTSVFVSEGSNKFATLLSNGNNLALANMIVGIDDPEAYSNCNEWLKLTDEQRETNLPNYLKYINDKFIPKIVEYFGQVTLATSVAGAMDVSAADQVYRNLVSTLNMTETSIMAIIIPITIIIVGIISNLIINDSKKMAAMLKALGYSDMKNIMSILALFVPTIILGLLLAIPLSFGLVAGYQAAIFTSANILVDVTQRWWYYVVAVGGIGVVLFATYLVGYRSLKKDRLVDQIK